jgi:hypothetical protein
VIDYERMHEEMSKPTALCLCRQRAVFSDPAYDGTLVLQGSDNSVQDWQVIDLLGRPASSVTASFKQLFKVYRGARFTDELESLGSSAAKSVNRLRSQMSRTSLLHCFCCTLELRFMARATIMLGATANV